MNSIQETLEYILRSIVGPDAELTINSSEDNGVLMMEIVAPEEFKGHIIGKEGKTIKAIRTLLNAAYPQQRYLLTIKD